MSLSKDEKLRIAEANAFLNEMDKWMTEPLESALLRFHASRADWQGVKDKCAIDLLLKETTE